MLLLSSEEKYFDRSISNVQLRTGFTSSKNGFHSLRFQKTKQECYFQFVKRMMAIHSHVK
jgi:hypothetical protein